MENNIREPSKLDRKEVEKKRRIEMKNLCLNLISLIPSHLFNPTISNKDLLTQQEQIDFAASYIKQLKERIDVLKIRKEEEEEEAKKNLKEINGQDKMMNNFGSSSSRSTRTSLLPLLDIKESDSSIEVIVISGLNKNFMLYEVISVLEEEGAEVVCASFSIVGDKIFHSLHAQVKISRLGIETSRVWQRLEDLVY